MPGRSRREPADPSYWTDERMRAARAVDTTVGPSAEVLVVAAVLLVLGVIAAVLLVRGRSG